MSKIIEINLTLRLRRAETLSVRHTIRIRGFLILSLSIL